MQAASTNPFDILPIEVLCRLALYLPDRLEDSTLEMLFVTFPNISNPLRTCNAQNTSVINSYCLQLVMTERQNVWDESRSLIADISSFAQVSKSIYSRLQCSTCFRSLYTMMKRAEEVRSVSRLLYNDLYEEWFRDTGQFMEPDACDSQYETGCFLRSFK